MHEEKGVKPDTLFILHTTHVGVVVELSGIEPLTSTLPV